MSESENTSSLIPPSVSPMDKALAVCKAAISATPLVGSPAAELFSYFITPPLQRRLDKWRHEVGSCLARLADNQKINLDELQNNNAFIDLVMNASQAVSRNCQEEKLTALRNAIENAAQRIDIDEAIQHMFIHWVDELTIWHLRILKLFQDPNAWGKANQTMFGNVLMGSLSSVLEDAYPQMKVSRPFYDQVWRDLYQRGLVSTDNLHGSMTGNGLLTKRTTVSGDQFLRFIESR